MRELKLGGVGRSNAMELPCVRADKQELFLMDGSQGGWACGGCGHTFSQEAEIDVHFDLVKKKAERRVPPKAKLNPFKKER